MSRNSRLVYTTDAGRIKETPPAPSADPGGGIVRIGRESKGRGGKTVSIVRGIPGQNLTSVAHTLKSACATGGAVKNSTIEIQGDHRERIGELLEQQGYRIKHTGGS